MSVCDQTPTLTYAGLITDKDRLRHLIGRPSTDPADAGYFPDVELQNIIDRHKARLDEIAGRRHTEQCRQFDLQRKAANANVSAKEEEILLSGVWPEGAKEYTDEIAIKVVPSAAEVKHQENKPAVNYGIVPEGYVNNPIAVTVIDNNGLRYECSRSDNLFPLHATSSPFTRWRYGVRGRRIYVTNNGRFIETVYAWLVHKTALKEFLETLSPEVQALEDFRFLENDALVADVVDEMNEFIQREARNALASLVGEGTRLEMQGDE